MGYGTDGLTFNTLRAGNETRLRETPKFAKCREWSNAQWMCALVGEVGELANLLKKYDRGDFTELDIGAKANVAKELADIQTYLDLPAMKLGVDLGKATMDKFDEVSKRVGANVYIDHDGWHRYRDEWSGKKLGGRNNK